MTLNGVGIVTKDYILVHDVARAFVWAKGQSNSDCDISPNNFGARVTASSRKMAEMMILIIGKLLGAIGLQEALVRQEDASRFIADIFRVHELLGWRPEFSLEDGLRTLF